MIAVGFGRSISSSHPPAHLFENSSSSSVSNEKLSSLFNSHILEGRFDGSAFLTVGKEECPDRGLSSFELVNATQEVEEFAVETVCRVAGVLLESSDRDILYTE